MKLPQALIFLTILLVLSSCTPELSKYCPDPETSYKAEKFKYGSRLAYKQSRVKSDQPVDNTHRIMVKEVKEDYPILALATKTNEVYATNEMVFSENIAFHLAKPSGSILSSPVMDKSKITVKQRQNVAKLIKQVESKQQDPVELHYKTRRMGIASTLLGIGAPIFGAIAPFLVLLSAVLGFTLGMTALRNYRDLDDQTGRGYATFGMIINGLWIILILAAIALLLAFLASWDA